MECCVICADVIIKLFHLNQSYFILELTYNLFHQNLKQQIIQTVTMINSKWYFHCTTGKCAIILS